ncbi:MULTISPECIES: hypothetical protein [Pseudomonadati]|uniref:Uncharacterized protein n=1 Tax=Shewanella aestuarii TaxID=1028752 RepID=A0ABT0L362_9GAMM|nr:hypothetical protein [Shewanella aestuarii]MCL1118157.1 hypothetical protein [Shewanella aestuarii]GGN81554.1 hypothetical protein GCM10009193_27870 [Shewanella aestuarii]
MKILLSLFGFTLFGFSVFFGWDLLDAEKISGGEFVTVVIAFAVLGLIISFASEVQEFSVAGNIVKLKEVRKEADKSIEDLKKARVGNFIFLLKLAARFPGGFGSGGTVDERLDDFWLLYKQIKESNNEHELKLNIKEVTRVLLSGQLDSIRKNSDLVEEKYSREALPEPDELLLVALESESINKAASRNVCGGDVDRIKKAIVVGLDEYKKLYKLHAKCSETHELE